METLAKRTTRPRHSWKNNTCIHCGCYRIQYYHETMKHYSYWLYDPETGEEKHRVQCYSKQTILNF